MERTRLAHPDRVDADLVVAAGVVARGVGDDLDQVARRVVDVVDLGRIAAGAGVDVSQSAARALRHAVDRQRVGLQRKRRRDALSCDGSRASSSAADTAPMRCSSVRRRDGARVVPVRRHRGATAGLAAPVALLS